MDRLEDYEAFLAIVEHGSLTAAARRLDRSLQSISRSLAALEASVGVELVHRTTRRSMPSETGMAFYQRVGPAIEELRQAKLDASNRRVRPSGVLRLSAPVLFGPEFLMAIIADYMRRHPEVEVDLQLSDAFVDVVAENIDLAVRIGELPHSNLRAKRLGKLRRVVFGAPSYLDRHGRPRHPSDLTRHTCILRTVDQRFGEWMFEIDGKQRAVKVTGPLRVNSMIPIYAAVCQGLGLGYSPLWQIRRLVDEGHVEVVLEAFESAPVPIHALWREGRATPAKVRAFLDMLAANLDLSDL